VTPLLKSLRRVLLKTLYCTDFPCYFLKTYQKWTFSTFFATIIPMLEGLFDPNRFYQSVRLNAFCLTGSDIFINTSKRCATASFLETVLKIKATHENLCQWQNLILKIDQIFSKIFLFRNQRYFLLLCKIFLILGSSSVRYNNMINEHKKYAVTTA
jgi:hypothetical protein